MEHLPRRALTIGLAVLAGPLWLVLSPLAFIIGLVVDRQSRRMKLPIIRLWLFALVFVAHEWFGQARALHLWLAGGFGRRLSYRKHQRMQGWWSTSLLRWARRLLNVQVTLDDPETIPDGDLIVFSRHASMVDAILPAHLFAGILDRSVHYVIKRELRWLPNIDVYGHRLRNHFVNRAGDRDREVEEIARLAGRAEPNAALVIFPEGSYGTPAIKARVQASLERKGDEHGARLNRELRHLLPPRPAGSLALLRARPDAPVMILGHVGLEGVAELDGLRSNLPATVPLQVRWWIHERRELPTDDAELAAWLEDQWRLLDNWVDQELQGS